MIRTHAPLSPSEPCSNSPPADLPPTPSAEKRRNRSLISQNANHDCLRHLAAIHGIVNFFAFDRVRHIAAFNQNRRHRGVTQNRITRPAHPAVLRAEISHQRFLDLVRQQQTFVFTTICHRRTEICALALRVGGTGADGRNAIRLRSFDFVFPCRYRVEMQAHEQIRAAPVRQRRPVGQFNKRILAARQNDIESGLLELVRAIPAPAPACRSFHCARTCGCPCPCRRAPGRGRWL